MINNTQAPSYRIAKFLNRKLQDIICLPYSYTKKNLYGVARDLHNIQINENNKIITLDIKDLYVNLPIKNILRVTEFWLNKHNQDHVTTDKTLYLLEIILRQNYFQYNNQFYQPNKGIAMGSPISMRSVNKVMRLIQYNSVLTFKLQIEFVPFKIVPLRGYTPQQTLFPLFIATLVVANWNRF